MSGARPIYAKIVQKVGEREYWENWAGSVADIAIAQTDAHPRSARRHPRDAGAAVRSASSRACAATSTTASPRATRSRCSPSTSSPGRSSTPVRGLQLRRHNPVAQRCSRCWMPSTARTSTPRPQALENFYATVRTRVAGIDRRRRASRSSSPSSTSSFFSTRLQEGQRALRHRVHAGRDRGLHPAQRRRAAAQRVRQPHSTKGVHILDPFTGTGTFMVRLLQSGSDHRPRDLAAQVRRRAARQRDPAARVLHRRRQHRGHLPRACRPCGAARLRARSRASCSPTPSRCTRTATTLDREVSSRRTTTRRSGRRSCRSR